MLRAASNGILSGAAVAASLAAIALLAGCGGGGSDSTGTAAGGGPARSRASARKRAQREATQPPKLFRGFCGRERMATGRRPVRWSPPRMVENLRRYVSQTQHLKNKDCPELVQAVIPAIPAKTIARRSASR